MNQHTWMKPMFLSLAAVATLLVCGAQASSSDRAPALHTTALKNAKVGGKWRIAWDVRGGTARGILVLKQSAAQVTGTFEESGYGTYSLSGSIQGQTITFVIPFPGPPPYTIEFKGTVDEDKITGTSGLKGGGKPFLGHAGEVDEPQRPWIALKGLKRQPASPHAPPKEDDDD